MENRRNGLIVISIRRTLLAIALLCMLPNLFAAGYFRFLREDSGARKGDGSDDYQVATKIKWADNFRPPVWTLGINREINGGIPGSEIIPFFNNVNNITDDQIRAALMECITGANQDGVTGWNEVGSEFQWAENYFTSDAFGGQDPSYPFGPEGQALDLRNLIVFNPQYGMGVDGLGPGVLGVAIFTYFNRDLDLSNPNGLPPYAETIMGGVLISTGTLSFGALPWGKYSAGDIIDADIVFNNGFPGYTLPPDNGNPADYLGSPDIQSTLLHEMGHAASLTHSQLLSPTMTPFVLPSTNPYGARKLDFDDRLSLKMTYKKLFSRLGKGAIGGRLFNGAAVDGVPDESPVIAEIMNTPVFIGRPTSDPYDLADDVFGTNELTSMTQKIRLFTSVFSSPEFMTNQIDAVNAPVFRDNRYFVGGLPASDEEINIGYGDKLPANDYAVYIRPANPSTVDEVTGAFIEDSNNVPPEFYGGAKPFIQPGSGNSPLVGAVNGDGKIQDRFLTATYNALGQFGLYFTGTTTTLVEKTTGLPTESYITYRLIQDGQTTDVTNTDLSNFSSVTPFVEDDVADVATASFQMLGGAITSTEKLELGQFRRLDGQTSSPQSDLRLTVQIQNNGTSEVQVGTRILVRTYVDSNGDVRFFLDDNDEVTNELTLTGNQIPNSFTFGEGALTRNLGLATLYNENSSSSVTLPSKVQFANYFRISQFGYPQPKFFDFNTDSGIKLTDGCYAVQFDPQPVPGGSTITFSTSIGYIYTPVSADGPVPVNGLLDLPGEDDPIVYTPVKVSTNTATLGIDIYTNTGAPGGLFDDGSGPTEGPDRDGDGIPNEQDNCEFVPNPGQEDSDGDGIGNACDQDYVTFTDISPSAPGTDRKDGMPPTGLYAQGVVFGDVNNDGYVDLAVATGAEIGGSGASSVNRLFLNRPSTDVSELEPNGGRKFVDMTFGADGVATTNTVTNINDDRMPFHQVSTSEIVLADFDNDGDLDMFVANFAAPGYTGTGFQNMFYRNDDVDDPQINPEADGDSLGDGFFTDVTLAWDSGILNQGAFNEYLGGYDYTTAVDVGDIDLDGDMDIILANTNTMVDTALTTSGFGSTPFLLFSERVLINTTNMPANTEVIYDELTDVQSSGTLFVDETLGADNVFGGIIPDRLPPVKPEWDGDTTGYNSQGYSNTWDIKLGTTYWGPSGNAMSLYIFDRQGTPLANIWDGMEQIYANADVNFDGVADGFYGDAVYGTEDPLRGAPDAEGVPRRLWLGLPDGITGDITAVAEFDQLENVRDSTVAGLVFDTDYSAWPEMVVFNAGNPTLIHGSQDNLNVEEVRRGMVSGFGETNGFWYNGGEHEEISPGRPQVYRRDIRYRTNMIELPVFGRPRDAVTEDFNLDGLPDMAVAFDFNQNTGLGTAGLPAGYNALYLNEDVRTEFTQVSWSAQHQSTTPFVTNDSPHFALSIASADVDNDGDLDYVTGNAGQPLTLYRNNLRAHNVPPTVPGGTSQQAPDTDFPLFVDQTFKLIAPYFTTTNQRGANGSLGVALADLNGDGNLDLGFANGGLYNPIGEYQVIYKNNRSNLMKGEKVKSEKVFTPMGSSYGVAAVQSDMADTVFNYTPFTASSVLMADFSGDGVPDIFYTVNGTNPDPNDPVRLRHRMFFNRNENDPERNSYAIHGPEPDGAFEDVTITALPDLSTDRLGARSAAFGDVNGDGFLDIVIGNSDGTNGALNVVLISMPDGLGERMFVDQSSTWLPPGIFDDTIGTVLTDVDNDGDLDLIFANRAGSGGSTSPNFYDKCRLLLNDGSTFVEVVDPAKWPMISAPGAWEGVIVGDFTDRGERGEDLNGNRIMDATEDKNLNGVLDFVDSPGGIAARHDLNIDVIFTTSQKGAPHMFLANDGNLNDGSVAFTDQSATRFITPQGVPYTAQFPTYGGDAGDVNNDGLVDVVFAMDTQTLDSELGPNAPGTKIPVALLMNTISDADGAGVMVDASGNDPVTSNSVRSSRGELPVLKVQFAYTADARTVPGNSRAVKLADIDNDGDLDLVIAQLGRKQDAGVQGVGWFNNILVNMQNAWNFAARSDLSLGSSSAPSLYSANPAVVAPGQQTIVELRGKNFAGLPATQFGDGITVQEVYPAENLGRTLRVLIKVAPDANDGSRIINVVNPDTQQATGSNGMFQVSSDLEIPVTAVQQGWESLYE